MFVVKRDGRKEEVSFDKVLRRIQASGRGLEVNPVLIAQKVLARIYDGVRTSELDELAAHLASAASTVQPDYGTLAARIAISNHQANTVADFAEVIHTLSTQTHPKTGAPIRYISEELQAVVAANAAAINARIDYERDFLFDYFGFKTLERAYLLKDSSGKIIERPQHMWMRVALGIWGADLENAFRTYDLMSTKMFTHATPTLFNAGTPNPQLSSCYLLAVDDDSIAGIYKTLSDSAKISKHAGGIGIHIHNIRAKGSLIHGTNGTSNGIVPMLRVFNSTARYVDQCFTPETLVYTLNGPKCIEEIGVTDKVLTSEGRYENVILPIRHDYKGKMFDIQVKNAISPIRVTPEHQIYALKGQAKGLNFDVIKNRLDKKLASPEFYDANELDIGDFVVYPIPSYVEDIDTITEEDCRFYGILLGDGHISAKTSGITLNTTTKITTLEFVKQYLTNRGVTITLVDKDSNTIDVRWSNSSPGFKFTRSQVYDTSNQKTIQPSFLHLPIPKIKQLIRGLIETDGCVGEKEIAIEMTSKSIIESMRYMLLRLGALGSGYNRNRIGNVSSYRNITTRLETSVLRVPRIKEIMEMFPDAPKGEYFTYLKHGNYIYSRIQDITETEYDGIVHDFEIAGPHDYTVAHLGIAHNGGGKRNGSFAIYLEPWHDDIDDFLKLKLNTGAEEERARDLFYALWVPDLFMERVEAGADWTLFCPAEAPGLADVWGDEFRALYERYEAEGRGRRKIPAQQLWFSILSAQIETGTPYLVYKDAANRKSNQQNLGTIKSSNLCVAPETRILTDRGEVAIKDVAGQQVRVWNGDAWSETTVVQTGVNQPLMKVVIRDAIVGNEYRYSTIECTPYHKFILQYPIGDPLEYRVDAKDLTAGNILKQWTGPDGLIHHPLVVSVEHTGRTADTYCFNEPVNHAGVFNGILTGNCSEIIEYSSPEETAVCNLASIVLPSFVDAKRKVFDFTRLREVVAQIVRNLDRVIDINFYPTPETRRSNLRHRPIGIGVQGLADVLALMRHPWESEAAAELNQRIFEHLYYAAVQTSAALSVEKGAYETFAGSPASQGRLQPDLWGTTPLTAADGTLDWDGLRAAAATGLRNSLLVAPMPTASTSQIMGSNEAIEPFTSNIYTRRTLAGEFIVVNRYLMADLVKFDMWDETMKQRIIAHNGSIQDIPEIPDALKRLYKTAWEIKQRTLIDMAAARGAFVCQSQSLNLFVPEPNFAKLTSMHFYGWKRGLKTGVYYLRTKAPAAAQKFTVDPELLSAVEADKAKRRAEQLAAEEGCLHCSS